MSSRRITPAGRPASSTSRKSRTVGGPEPLHDLGRIVAGEHDRVRRHRPATSDAGAWGDDSANARAAGTSSSPRAMPPSSVKITPVGGRCRASQTGVSVGQPAHRPGQGSQRNAAGPSGCARAGALLAAAPTATNTAIATPIHAGSARRARIGHQQHRPAGEQHGDQHSRR